MLGVVSPGVGVGRRFFLGDQRKEGDENEQGDDGKLSTAGTQTLPRILHPRDELPRRGAELC